MPDLAPIKLYFDRDRRLVRVNLGRYQPGLSLDTRPALGAAEAVMTAAASIDAPYADWPASLPVVPGSGLSQFTRGPLRARTPRCAC